MSRVLFPFIVQLVDRRVFHHLFLSRPRHWHWHGDRDEWAASELGRALLLLVA